ncbi:MAG: fibronectin type III domain-containing protein [Elusimicrobiota bacterium]
MKPLKTIIDTIFGSRRLSVGYKGLLLRACLTDRQDVVARPWRAPFRKDFLTGRAICRRAKSSQLLITRYSLLTQVKNLRLQFLRQFTLSLCRGVYPIFYGVALSLLLFSSVPIYIYAAASFTVEAGSTFTLTNYATFDCDGDITTNISGAVRGEFQAGTGEVRLSGNWTNNGIFVQNTSTVTFYGTGTSTLAGGTTFFVLSCTEAGKQINFTAGSQQVIDNTLILTGTSGNEIKLRSSASGSKWYIKLSSYQAVDYVDVQDCDVLTMNLLCRNSENSDRNNANIIFDYVQMMVVYSSGTLTYPWYRILSQETTFWSTMTPGPAFASTIQHLIAKECPKRDEFLLAALNDAGEIYIATWTLQGNWGANANNPVGTGMAASYDDFRAIDIAYESSSGEGMIVYHEGTNDMIYRTWDGSTLGAELSVGLTGAQGTPNFIRLVNNPASDANELVVVWISTAGFVGAKVWDGVSSWGNEVILSTNSASPGGSAPYIDEAPFDAAYMRETSNNCMVVYATHSPTSNGILQAVIWNGTAWGTPVDAADVTDAIEFVSLKPNTTNMMIAVVLDAGDDVNTIRYQGSTWEGLDTPDSGARGVLCQYADACWESAAAHENHVVVAYSDAADIDSTYFDGATWTDITGIQGDESNFLQLERAPDNEIWLCAYEEDNNILYVRIWDSINHVWGSSTVIEGPWTFTEVVPAEYFCLTASATVTPPIVNQAPDQPSNLTQLVGTNNDIGLAWNTWTDDTTPRLKFDLRDPNANEQVSYHIQISTKETYWASPYLVVDTTQPASGYLNEGTTWYDASLTLTVDTSYYWRVKCIDDGGLESVYSSGTISAGEKHWGGYIPPGPVTDLSATGDTKSTADGDFQKIKLSWIAPGDDNYTGTVSSYVVRYATWAAGDTQALWDTWWDHPSVMDAKGQPEIPTPTAAGTAQNCTLTGLSEGTTYYWAIRSVDDNSFMSQIDTMTQAGPTQQAWARVPGTYHPIKIDGAMTDWSTTTEEMDIENNTTFYFTWSSTAVYICYGGTDGNLSDPDGSTADFLVFFDTHSSYDITKGTNIPPVWDNINTHRLPFGADYALCIESGSAAGDIIQLRKWNGSTWYNPGNGVNIANEYIGYSANKITEVAITWTNLDNPSTLRVVAFHKWDAARNIYNSFPDDNPAPNDDSAVTFLYYYNFTSTQSCQFPAEFATVEAPYPPDPPAGLTQLSNTGTALPSMQWTNSTTIISSFTQSDPNSGTNNVRFYLHVTSVTTASDAADWSQLWHASTSGWLAEGTTGYQWPTLANNGTYWWQVWSEDEGGLTSSTSTDLGQGGSARLGFDNVGPATPASITLSNQQTALIGIDISWSATTDSLSGLASYYIYCSSVSAITDDNKGDGDHYLLTYKSPGTTSHSDTRSELLYNSTYYYAVCGVDRAGNIGSIVGSSKLTHRIEVDSDEADWQTSSLPANNNEGQIYSLTTGNGGGYIWVWNDKDNEERGDAPDPDTNYDIEEFRITADDEYVYFRVRYQTLTVDNTMHISVSIDTNTTVSSGLSWIGDNSKESGSIELGNEYGNLPDNSNWAETNIDCHDVTDGSTRIELFKPGWNDWGTPSTPGDGANWVNAPRIDFMVARSDLGLVGNKTARIHIAAFCNQCIWNGGAGGGDSTWDVSYPGGVCDALDSVSIIRISTGTESNQYYNDPVGNGSTSMNAWDEDIKDGDIDFWFDLRFDANGILSNTAPPIPTNPVPLSGGTTNQIRPNFSWSQAADEDSGDTVTSYLIELATHTDLGSDLSQADEYGWRVNRSTWNWTVPTDLKHNTTFYWRVWSRDRCGALSSTPDTWSVIVDTVAPDAVTSLSALTGDNDGEIKLFWSTPGDDSTTGTPSAGALTAPSTYYITYTNNLTLAENYGWWASTNAQITITTSAVSYPEMQYRTVAALTAGDTYYFRIWTADEAGNLSGISNAATAQAKITPIADAFLIYYASSTVQVPDNQTPAYRRWESSAWQAEQITVDIGDTANRPMVIRKCPTRSEAIMVTVDAATDLNVSTYTPSGGWGLAGELTTNAGVSTKRAFDVAYEQVSGDAVIVYRKDTATAGLNYVTWDGGSTFPTTGPDNIDTLANIQRVRLEPKPSSNEMILAYSDNKGSIYVSTYNGTNFAAAPTTLLSGYAEDNSGQPFDIAYAQSAGVGFVVWVDTNSTRAKYRTWDGYSWSAETTTAHNHSPADAATGGNWLKAAANPTNNEIIIGTYDLDDDINAEVYSSTLCAWLNGVEHDATGPTSNSERGFDVAYEKTAGEGLIVWCEADGDAQKAQPQAYTYINGVWTAEHSTTDNPDTSNINYVQLAPDDDSNEIFVVTNSTANWVCSQKWDGAAWGTVTTIENNSSGSYEDFSMNFKKPAAPSDTIAPAAVTSLSGLTVTTSTGTILLTWSAPGDDVWLGRLTNGSKYQIKYCTSTTEATRVWYYWTAVSSPTGSDAFAPGLFLSTTIQNLVGDTSYYCLLNYQDEAGNWADGTEGNWTGNLANEATAYAYPQILSVSISTPVGGYNFGEVALGASTQSVAGVSGSSITVTNNGNIPENFAIKCETGTAGTPWSTTGTAADDDIFILKAAFHSTSQPAFTAFGTEDIVSSGTYKTSQTQAGGGRFTIDGTEDGVSVPVDDTIDLWLRLDMPTTSGTADPQEIILFIRAESP